MNVTELKQLVAVGELESFSEVARRFYVSTPTVARAMQRIERCYGVELFVHGKNKVELNEAGRLAVAGARRILREIDASVAEVRAYDRSLRTIDLISCARGEPGESARGAGGRGLRCGGAALSSERGGGCLLARHGRAPVPVRAS